jgi:hypothetical protein
MLSDAVSGVRSFAGRSDEDCSLDGGLQLDQFF